MWIYDGEEWSTDEGGTESERKREEKKPRYEELMPELQVVEIVPVPTKPNRVPLPLP
jgi:hypothetical protein